MFVLFIVKFPDKSTRSFSRWFRKYQDRVAFIHEIRKSVKCKTKFMDNNRVIIYL